MTQMPIALAPGEGEALWFFGMLTLFKATGEQTGGQFSLIEQLGHSNVATPLHRQREDQETFFVLDGQLRFYLGEGETFLAPAGASVYVPAGATHAFEVVSDTARWLNLTTPNHEAFFRAAGEPAQARAIPPETPPDMDKVMSAAQRFGVEILGPPPGREH